jgi:hypothetical protein
MFRTATLRLAHKNAAYAALGGNADLRLLQDVIDAEKAVISSFVFPNISFARGIRCLTVKSAQAEPA